MPVIVQGGVAVIDAPTSGFTTFTAANLIDAVAEKLQRWARGTATGGTTTTMIANHAEPRGMTAYPDHYWRNFYLKCLAGVNANNQFFIRNWDTDTHEASFWPQAASAWINGDEYRVTGFDQIRALSYGAVRGTLDQAIDRAYDHLHYQIANDDLVLITSGLREYNYRTIGAQNSWIHKLNRVQWRSGTTEGYYSDVPFELVGDGSTFRLTHHELSTGIIRLLGDGPVLRTDANGLVKATLSTETDKVIIETGREQILILEAVCLLLRGELMGSSNLAPSVSLQQAEADLARLKRTMEQPPEPEQLPRLWF